MWKTPSKAILLEFVLANAAVWARRPRNHELLRRVRRRETDHLHVDQTRRPPCLSHSRFRNFRLAFRTNEPERARGLEPPLQPFDTRQIGGRGDAAEDRMASAPGAGEADLSARCLELEHERSVVHVDD